MFKSLINTDEQNEPQNLSNPNPNLEPQVQTRVLNFEEDRIRDSKDYEPTISFEVWVQVLNFEEETNEMDFYTERIQRFGFEVIAAVQQWESRPTGTSFQSPWENGVAERSVESCRKFLLDHVIVLKKNHLKRLLSEYGQLVQVRFTGSRDEI